MTEKEIQLLGFKKEHSLENDFYYYKYKIAEGFEFISNADDEVGEDKKWFIEIFNTDPIIRFTNPQQIQSLINMLEKQIVK